MKYHRILCVSAIFITLVGSINVNAQTESSQEQAEKREDSNGLKPTKAEAGQAELAETLEILRRRNYEIEVEIRKLQRSLEHRPSGVAIRDNPTWLEQYNRDRDFAERRIDEYQAEMNANKKLIQEKEDMKMKKASLKRLTNEEMIAQVMNLLSLWGHDVDSIQIVFKDGETQSFKNAGFNEAGENIFSSEIESPLTEDQAESEDLRK